MAGSIRVLLVEDDPRAPVLWEGFFRTQPDLQLCGWARDGWSALEMAERLRPDAVLLELILPGMDGLELLHRLKRLSRPPAVAVTTPISNTQVIRQATALGADYYFVKPVRFHAAAELLRALCGGAVEGYARQLLVEMGGAGLGMEAACAVAAELADHQYMLLKEAYAPFIRRAHTSYSCVEKNIRRLTSKIHAAGSPAYLQMMGGLPESKPNNAVFLRRLSQAALERQAAAGEDLFHSFP